MLVLRSVGLSDDNVKNFMEYMNANESMKLKCLELSEINISELSKKSFLLILGIEYIANGLQNNTSLEFLSLPRNNIKSILPLFEIIR